MPFLDLCINISNKLELLKSNLALFGDDKILSDLFIIFVLIEDILEMRFKWFFGLHYAVLILISGRFMDWINTII